MGKSIVALVPCSTYDENEVYQAVARGIDLIGGLDKWFSREETILIKPNMLGRAAPEQAVTTHPAVFQAAARLLIEKGFAHLSYGDSPGPTSPSPQRVAEGCGIAAIAGEMGIPLADFLHGRLVPCPEGRITQSLLVANGVLVAGAILNIAKMKTHALQRLTGAVKNLYGCIPGQAKTVGHARYPDAIRFARMLADLNKLLKPRLHIMDGIVAMEGNGPSSGTPVDMGVLLFSGDPVALDSVFCRLVNLSPAMVATNVAGEQAGLGTWHEDQIKVVTPEGVKTVREACEKYGKPSFQVDRGSGSRGLAFHLLGFLPGLRERPVADPEKCIRCGACVESCPVDGKALALDRTKDKAPRYDYRKCIRCYCCQEACTSSAITVYKPFKRKK